MYNNIAYYTLNNVATAVSVQKGENIPGTVKAVPTMKGMTLTLPFTQPYQLSLHSADGRALVSFQGNSPREVDLGAVKPGIYLLSGQVDGLAWQRKLFLK